MWALEKSGYCELCGPAFFEVMLEVKVDQLLGPHGFVITNINDDGISVTGLSGNAMFIPVSTFPINIEGGNSSAPAATPTPVTN